MLGNSLSNSCWTDGCWFLSISPFAIFAKPINNVTIYVGGFSLFMIPITRGMHWPQAIFIVFRTYCLAGLCRVFTFNFISKSVKIKSWKILRGEKLLRYEGSEKNFLFDETTIPKKHPINFKCQYRYLTSVTVS